jgi:iron-sulfur cluster assembly protein/iron-sulfur cluster insertion protein
VKRSDDPEAAVTLTARTVAKAKELLAQEPAEGDSESLSLRVRVQPGGCKGLRYNLYFDSQQATDDEVTQYDGLSLRVDHDSVELLSGSVVDYVDGVELGKSGFTINNPRASAKCGCGGSFC